jgi:hypothetical protein
MASSAPALRVALLVLAVVSVAGVRAVPQQASESGSTSTCSTDLFRLLPCLPFIDGSAAAPADTCCANLGSMVHDEPQCLCQALSNPSTAPVAVNMTRVMGMPRLCRLDLPSAAGACAGEQSTLPFQRRVSPISVVYSDAGISMTCTQIAYLIRARDLLLDVKFVFDDDLSYCSRRASSAWTVTATAGDPSAPKRELHRCIDPDTGEAEADDATCDTVTVGERPDATVQQGLQGDCRWLFGRTWFGGVGVSPSFLKHSATAYSRTGGISSDN